MSISVQQAADNFGKIAKDLSGAPNAEIMVKTAISAFTLLRGRVQETGTNAKGQKYKPYSTKPMLVGCKSFKTTVCNTLLASKEKRKKLEWRTVNGHKLAILPGGYKQWRELMLGPGKGDLVNFSVTNAMWNDINVISKQSDHAKGIAIIGAKQDIEKKKLAGNTKRRGDILDLSASEIEDLKLTYNLGVLQIFRNNGL